MNHPFSRINTTISVKENRLLTVDLLNQLIEAPSIQAIHQLLQGTPYAMTLSELENPDQVEKKLMDYLASEYDSLFEETPYSEIVEIFSSQYLYHNLKVLAKIRATGQSLEGLLIPIGKYDLDTLRYLVTHLESKGVYPSLVEEVRRTWSEYEVYRLTDAIDVGFDGAYFAHLRMLSERMSQYAHVKEIAYIMIEFYNLITVKRAEQLKKNHSFMKTMMTSQGFTQKDELIDRVENHHLAEWFERMSGVYNGDRFIEYQEAMQDGTITALQLEELRNYYLADYLNKHRFEFNSPIQLMNYIFKLETEIRTLRLILVGKINKIPKEKIREKVGPIYGEKI